MAKAVIINNPIELCDNWGWYVDIESQKIKKFKPIHIVEIFEQEVHKNDDEYEYYMNQEKKIKIKNSLETILEEEEEDETDCKKRKPLYACHILRVTSVTIITCLLTYIILFVI